MSEGPRGHDLKPKCYVPKCSAARGEMVRRGRTNRSTCRRCVYENPKLPRQPSSNLPGWCWARIKQLALIGSSSSLHSEACKALGGSDGVVHSTISLAAICMRAVAKAFCLQCCLWLKTSTPPKMPAFHFPAGGSCVPLSPKWGLAGEVQVAVVCPADCVEGLP